MLLERPDWLLEKFFNQATKVGVARFVERSLLKNLLETFIGSDSSLVQIVSHALKDRLHQLPQEGSISAKAGEVYIDLLN